ncbi:hypothetical protein KSP39_PZI008421 [Platanthera zijinensis]|uniref:Uncharacterized protein n=1 Tax=Platanthera zijinensis TaxID=2320716 RepID=A0AAP0BNU2_9ASPA
MEYYGRHKQLWDELNTYEQIPTCKCGKCDCNIGQILEKKQEEERVHSFLMGLDGDVYGMVRSNILAQEPLPRMNKVYSILVQEERVKTVVRGREDRGDMMALTARASRVLVDNKDKTNLVCSHCNRTGHETNTCFALHGYPERWGDRPRSEGKTSGMGRSRGRSTHRGGRGGTHRVNAVAAAAVTSGSEGDVSNSHSLPGLNNEQWQTLLTLLNGSKSTQMTGPHFEDADWSG